VSSHGTGLVSIPTIAASIARTMMMVMGVVVVVVVVVLLL
jgi:hypothetical protein